MRIKTHLNNALYQITAVCYEYEHELVIAELQLVQRSVDILYVLLRVVVIVLE